MHRNFFLVLVFMLTAVSCSPATRQTPTHHLSIDEHLQLALVLPSPRWQLSEEPPDFLAQKMTDHLRQEVSAFAPDIEVKQLLSLAQKRLAVNEGYVFNKHSGALLMIDFSLRREGKGGPALSELQASASGALLALENEEGVADLESHIGSLAINGGSRAGKMEANYSLDGKPQLFMGSLALGHRIDSTCTIMIHSVTRRIKSK
ncbi:hypothetical protein A7E78_03125 [Syntrophotalea acetylenivorans]|uniref:Lipoprotein n=1 Tax=Syntrophotalea acetylenivorans TaxID=1842532 RepID=A0A1L3GLU7_9BACT|nr:hypothetical protein [Syntrophotalea acetylenivorans]APG26916.1 hypothetical protein A7E78_03125 [Syntrophotalea acetylenivorans]